MKKKDMIVLSIIAVLVLLLACGIVANEAGYKTGYEDGTRDATPIIFDPPNLHIEEYVPPMTEEEQMILLIDRLAGGVETANITIEFDSSGASKGSIYIYYNTKE